AITGSSDRSCLYASFWTPLGSGSRRRFRESRLGRIASQGQRGEMPPKRVLEPRTPRLGALGAAIEQTRKKEKMSQHELRKRAGVHPTHVSGLERGARNPTYETLGQIADGLETTIGKLATRADRILSQRES